MIRRKQHARRMIKNCHVWKFYFRSSSFAFEGNTFGEFYAQFCKQIRFHLNIESTRKKIQEGIKNSIGIVNKKNQQNTEYCECDKEVNDILRNTPNIWEGKTISPNENKK